MKSAKLNLSPGNLIFLWRSDSKLINLADTLLLVLESFPAKPSDFAIEQGTADYNITEVRGIRADGSLSVWKINFDLSTATQRWVNYES